MTISETINEKNIENNLVICIDPRKAFAIKSIPRSVFRNHHIRTKYVYFLLNFDFCFFIKTMTKQTVYLNNFAGKSGFRLQFLRQSAFSTHHCGRGLMTCPIRVSELRFLCTVLLLNPFPNDKF